MPVKLTERKIQDVLWHNLGQTSELFIPNYTPANWWECDVTRVMKSGYWEEYEIKLTPSDFRADARKSLNPHHIQRQLRISSRADLRCKHDRLAEGGGKGPNRFWYVIPEAMKDKVVIPPWAGVLYITVDQRERIRIESPVTAKAEGRGAPLLHRDKIDPDVVKHARGVFYWRFWNLRTKTT